jgi:broad specificity phosphatase PhoE
MGRLILIRHAESEGNAIRRFTTSPEAKITERGHRQAREAALKVGQMFKPTLVIASPYRRAHETGRIIAESIGIPIELEHGLREQSLGDLAGQPYDSILKDSAFDPNRSWLWRPPGGESLLDVLQRTGPVFDRIAAKYAGGEIAIVSHGGVMRALWAHVAGSWEGAHVPPNCGIVIVEHESGRYRPPRPIHTETTESNPYG